jgi:sialic acid synthase SpsE
MSSFLPQMPVAVPLTSQPTHLKACSHWLQVLMEGIPRLWDPSSGPGIGLSLIRIKSDQHAVVNAALIVERCRLFARLQPAARGRLAGMAKLHEFEAGATLFRQGDPCPGVFIVGRGLVRVFKLAPSGKEQVLHMAGPGATFAEAAVIGGFDCPAFAQAVEAGAVALIPAAEFQAFLKSDHQGCIDLLASLAGWLHHVVDLLEDLNAPAYKIASFEVVDLPLIKYAASTGKPMIISTGMADGEEIQEAIEAAREGGCKQLALLHCVSGYPAPAEDYNLRTIPDMLERFGMVTGLSDHTMDKTTAITSVAMGASIIEKHFTLDRSGGGPDDSFSLEPGDLLDLCQSAKTAWLAMGRVDYGRKSSEVSNVKFRRSLYFVQDMSPGDIITSSCIRSVRPGYGLPPKLVDDLVGRRGKRRVLRNTPVSLGDVY